MENYARRIGHEERPFDAARHAIAGLAHPRDELRKLFKINGRELAARRSQSIGPADLCLREGFSFIVVVGREADVRQSLTTAHARAGTPFWSATATETCNLMNEYPWDLAGIGVSSAR